MTLPYSDHNKNIFSRSKIIRFTARFKNGVFLVPVDEFKPTGIECALQSEELSVRRRA
ncbi:MAG: hypothetical protein ACJAUP_000283 [Cellvibrionaceae bacterium]|jgi:hypothetical protein